MYESMIFMGGLTMATYRVTIEWTTQLSREVDANSAEEAEQLAEQMYQEYQQGQNTHITGTDRRRSIELISADETQRF
jgi:hypothetical protein